MAALPKQLQTAISNASAKTGVPADLLIGIWRTETASSYPNPYANGLGYGGLFGTQVAQPFGNAGQTRYFANVGGPAQAQAEADTAAQILGTQIVEQNGNISGALHTYSGGGYTSVPGQTTFSVTKTQLGKIAGRVHALPSTAPSIGIIAPPFSLGTAGTAASVAGLAGESLGVAIASGSVSSPLDVFKWLSANALRGLELIGGILLAVLGLYLLARRVGLGPSPATITTPVVGKVAEKAAQLRPGKSPPPESEGGPAVGRSRKVVHHYHVDEASERREASRRRREAAPPRSPATDEIPF